MTTWPAPEVSCRDAVDAEIPRGAQAVAKAAEAAGWRVRCTYARGTYPFPRRDPKVLDSVAVRLWKTPRAAVGVWLDGKFDQAFAWGLEDQLRAVGAAELKALLTAETWPTPEVPTDAANQADPWVTSQALVDHEPVPPNSWGSVHLGDLVRGADQRAWQVSERGPARRWLGHGYSEAEFAMRHGGRTVTVTRKLAEPADIIQRADHSVEAAAFAALIDGGLHVELIEETTRAEVPAVVRPDEGLTMAEPANETVRLVAAGCCGGWSGPGGMPEDCGTTCPLSKTYCQQCDTATHTCPGCGDSVEHGQIACAMCSPYRVLVTGSRTWDDVTTIAQVLDGLHAQHGDRLIIVHGACPDGADDLADLWCTASNVPAERHPADWARHGKSAGHRRNHAMVDTRPDEVVAFMRDASPGTSGCVASARLAGLAVRIHEYVPQRAERPCDDPFCGPTGCGWEPTEHTADRGRGLLAPIPRATTKERAPVTDQFQNAVQPIKRDRWGRYMLPDPETGQERSWTRVTTLAKTLSDQHGLQQWMKRMVVKGVAVRPDLIAGAAAASLDDKQTLDSIAKQAEEAAGAKSGANLGTAFHTFTERVDRGATLAQIAAPAPLNADLADYVAKMRAAGLTVRPEYIERIVVVPSLGLAGTLDRLVAMRAAVALSVLDVKSGKDVSYSWLEIAIQEACYANATHMWNPETGQYELMPEVDKHRGLVIHTPIGKAKAQVYGVNLIEGWKLAQVAKQVRDARSGAKSYAWLVEPDDAAALALHNVSRASSRAELAALWERLNKQGLWTEEVNAAAMARATALETTPTLATANAA